jgi:hypothetical protein
VSEKQPTIEEWRRLYSAAQRVGELAPWDWMLEDEIFGVQNPDSGEIGFVSVMGAAGEHYSIAIYPGADALYDFLELEEAAREGRGEGIPAERVLEIPQLQASFEDRDALQKEDREVIKKLNLKFRGANNWPLFRTYSPGLFPWFLSSSEARFLTLALEQLLDVAPRFRDDDSILYGEADDDFLVRTPVRQNGKITWEDKIVRVPQPPLKTITPATLSETQLKALERLPRSNRVFELDLKMMPMPVREKKERPYFPYLLLIVDSESSFVLGVHLLEPTPSLGEMRARLPLEVAPRLATLGGLPGAIAVRNEMIADLLSHLAAELEIRIEMSPKLPALDEAIESMESMMRR